MIPEQINIEIAEYLGIMKWSYAPPERRPHCDLPNYYYDSNAMHQAKKALTGEHKIEFIDALCLIVSRDGDGPYSAITKAFYAEPNHEAEAFLRVVGKWKE